MASEVGRQTGRVVAATTLAFTFHNPHVYLDTVLLLGSIGNQYGGERWFFALGSCIGSILWFSGLGYGARVMANYMERPFTWRILDAGIGIVILLMALNVTMTHITS